MLTTISMDLAEVGFHTGHEAISFHGSDDLTVIFGQKNSLRYIYDELHKIYGGRYDLYMLESSEDYFRRKREEVNV